MNLEMLGQFPDSFCQDGDLDLGRTGILFVLAKLLYRLRLRLSVQSVLFRASAVGQVWISNTIYRCSVLPARSFTLFSFSANSFSSSFKDTI